MEDASDREALAAVARRCRDTDPGLLRTFAPDGLVAELADRPGRRIRAWVARLTAGNQTAGDQTAAEPETAPATDVGLLILVETGGPPRSRFSVAWLLVDPAVRRRGVALALVGEAVRHVRSLGGTAVEAETLAGWSAAAAFWRCLAGGPGDPTAAVGHRSAGTPET
ncbi:MAG: GNAT family N-acetyltransferase [Planctomycetia bacterium]